MVPFYSGALCKIFAALKRKNKNDEPKSMRDMPSTKKSGLEQAMGGPEHELEESQAGESARYPGEEDRRRRRAGDPKDKIWKPRGRTKLTRRPGRHKTL